MQDMKNYCYLLYLIKSTRQITVFGIDGELIIIICVFIRESVALRIDGKECSRLHPAQHTAIDSAFGHLPCQRHLGCAKPIF